MIFKPENLKALAVNPHAALDIGKAAEHLVCADLIVQGYRAYLSDQGLPYDVLVDIAGRVVRVQVKATCFPRNLNATGRAERQGYSFHIRRRGKRQDQRLCEKDCDIVAVVALDIAQIAYLPVSECGQTLQIMPPDYEFKGKFKRSRIVSFGGLTFPDALWRSPQ